MDRTEALTTLLVEAGQAHHLFEETELHGVYDEQWPQWYAEYAIDRGIADLLGRAVTADELATLLATANAEFERLEPRPVEPWAAYAARRLAATS